MLTRFPSLSFVIQLSRYPPYKAVPAELEAVLSAGIRNGVRFREVSDALGGIQSGLIESVFGAKR